MHKNLKNTVKIGAVILIVLCAFIAGYAYNSKQGIYSEELGIGNNDDLESPYRTALSLSDLPSGWEIQARGEMAAHDQTDYQRSLGWKEGYNIIFQKANTPNIYVTQFISLYDEENRTLILNETKTKIKQFNEGIGGNVVQYFIDVDSAKYRLDRLPDVNIGDESIAYKKSYINYREYFIYQIEFRKGDYVVKLTSPDYELLKDLAKKAEKKIV